MQIKYRNKKGHKMHHKLSSPIYRAAHFREFENVMQHLEKHADRSGYVSLCAIREQFRRLFEYHNATGFACHQARVARRQARLARQAHNASLSGLRRPAIGRLPPNWTDRPSDAS